MSMLGNFVGALSALLFTHNGVTDLTAIYYFVGAALVFGMLGTVIFIKEPEVDKSKLPPFHWGEFLRGIYTPLLDHDFRWVACGGGAGEVVVHLDRIDPPEGRCVRPGAS